MALLHRADLSPTKLELLTAWLPTRPWYAGPAEPELTRVSSFRFDDPAGAVGVDCLLVRAGDGPVLHTPLTYRDAPLDGAQHWLLGTTEHSVLGRRWVYDACGDPVYAAVLAHAICTGGGEAEEFLDTDGRLEQRAPAMSVRGSGSGTAPATGAITGVDEGDPTLIHTGTVALAVSRDLAIEPASIGPALTLTATWDGQPTPVVLAYIPSGRQVQSE